MRLPVTGEIRWLREGHWKASERGRARKDPERPSTEDNEGRWHGHSKFGEHDMLRITSSPSSHDALQAVVPEGRGLKR